MKQFLALSLSDVMLINVKMPTIVGTLTLMSRILFVVSLVEHEFFYNLGARPLASLDMLAWVFKRGFCAYAVSTKISFSCPYSKANV